MLDFVPASQRAGRFSGGIGQGTSSYVEVYYLGANPLSIPCVIMQSLLLCKQVSSQTGVIIMEVQELETWLFKGHIYVTPKEAARYLNITHKTVLGYILDGQLPVARIESRQLIELNTLIEYDQTRKHSAWKRPQEWRRQNT